MNSIFTKPEQVLKEGQLSQTDQTASSILDGIFKNILQVNAIHVWETPGRVPMPQSAPWPAQRGVEQHRTCGLQMWK